MQALQNVLVTGGAGFIGYHVVKRLLRLGCRVTIVDNLSNQNENYLHNPFGKDVKLYQTDIRDTEGLVDIVRQEKIDSCVHLAAKISVAESMKNPFETLDVNVRGTLSVLTACAESNVEDFAFASSAAVYGEPQRIPIPENHILSPSSPYGASKGAGEALVTSFKNSGRISNAAILRFFNVFGPGQSPEYAGVITRFSDRLSKGLPPVIFGDGRQTRDFVHVDDVARAIVLSVEARVSGTFNVGTGMPVSLNDLAQFLARMHNCSIEPVYSDPRSGDIRHSCADITAIKGAIPFSPVGLAQSIPASIVAAI